MIEPRRTPDQEHWRTPYRETPFHARTALHNRNHSWRPWAGSVTADTYEDATMEYFAIRSQAGVYDISPMIKYRVTGGEAAAFMDRLQLRSIARLKPGRVAYSGWCDAHGHLIDDGTVFRLTETDFRICCQERMLPWLLDSAVGFDVAIREESEEIAGLSLQGPLSFRVLQDAGLGEAGRLKPFDLAEMRLADLPILVSRTGFTGDLGYELFVDRTHALALWDRLFEVGGLHGLRPFGNAALNLARIEAGFIMAGFDFIGAEGALRRDRPRSPFELGLGWMVDLAKGPFNGRSALLEEKETGLSRFALVGLEIDGQVPADNSLVYYGRGFDRWTEAGHVTSAAWSPTGKRNIAIASLRRPYGYTVTDNLWVEIYALRELVWQKLMVKARIVERPFLKLARRTANPPGLT